RLFNPAQQTHQSHEPYIRLDAIEPDVHHYVKRRRVADEPGEAAVSPPEIVVARVVVVVPKHGGESRRLRRKCTKSLGRHEDLLELRGVLVIADALKPAGLIQVLSDGSAIIEAPLGTRERPIVAEEWLELLDFGRGVARSKTGEPGLPPNMTP